MRGQSGSTAAVVVGVDDSPGGRGALQLAVREALLRRLPLVLVRAWHLHPAYDVSGLLPVEALQAVQEAEADLLQQAAVTAAELAPDLECRPRLVQGRPADALVEASEGAALVVVGRHSGSSAWLGPVLGHLAVRAHCPVVAVPASSPTDPGPVVVGVDGSAVSVEAVAHAFDQASRWQVPLVAVLVVPPAFDAYLPSEEVVEQLREQGRRSLSEALAGWRERYPDVEVREQVSLDAALPALVGAAHDAGLLVVGSHGRGAVLRAALGSVSASLLRCAPCPLAVVRPPRSAEEAAAGRYEDLAAAPAQ